MANAAHLAICCGPVVTTWDCRNDTVATNTHSFCPNTNDDNSPVVDVSWNTSGQGTVSISGSGILYDALSSQTSILFYFLVLASCLAVENDKDNVVLTSTLQNTTLESFRHDARLKRPAANTPKDGSEAKATCISFGVKSRYLLVGDATGAVCLWDLKKKSRVRHYFHSNAALQVTLDPTDSNVLSLSENALNIFRLREGTQATSITGSAARLTKFTTSILEPRNVAIGTRIGSLDLYDISLQSKVLSMSSHTGAVTGLQYSAVNKLLLASASVDETLCFSDTATGKSVQHMTLGSPATSMSFHDDGCTCAVGTESGRVLVYDLRNPTEIVASHKADGQVSAVEFAPSNSNTSSSAASKPKRSAMSDSIEHSASSADELGRVIDSVLNRSQENKPPSRVATSPPLNKVRSGNGAVVHENYIQEFTLALVTLGCRKGNCTRRTGRNSR